MLALELIYAGRSLDALMRYLYENYGLTGTIWTQEDMPLILESIAGQSLDSFLPTYVDTNALLPLDSNFQLLEHTAIFPPGKPMGLRLVPDL